MVYLLQYAVVLGVEAPAVRRLAAAFPKWLFAAHLFWFTLGVVFGFEQQTFKAFAQRFRWPLAGAAVVLLVGGMVEWELLLKLSGSEWIENRQTLVDGLYAGAILLTFLAFTDVQLPFPGVLMDLGAKSFGIYLVHGIVMEVAARAIYRGAPWMLGWQWLFLPVVIAIGVATPLLLMNFVRRSRARAVYPYLFG